MTFQIPLSLLHLTTLPMGATNSVQILQGDITFITQDEMPDIAAAFMEMYMSVGLPLGMRPTAQDGISQLLLQTPCHSPLPFLVPLLWTSHTLAQTINTLAVI